MPSRSSSKQTSTPLKPLLLIQANWNISYGYSLNSHESSDSTKLYDNKD